MDNPSCVGLPNGRNAFLGRENQPDYIVCENDRTMAITKCPGGNNFDPIDRKCLMPEKPAGWYCLNNKKEYIISGIRITFELLKCIILQFSNSKQSMPIS